MLRRLTFACIALPCLLTAAERGQEAYHRRILPLLQKYCYDCHGDGSDKGDFALDEYPEYSKLIADKVLWDHTRQQLATHVMPPEKKDKPSLPERDEIVAWIDSTVFWFDPQKIDPGHFTMRRLNRNEYNNTIRDLLWVDTRPASQFPPDDTGYGYDNIGDVLTVSPLLMEKYIRAANTVAEKALDTSVVERIDLELGAKKFWNQKGETKEWEDVRWFHTDADAATKFTAPATGTYVLKLRVSATQAGPDAAKLELRVDDKEHGTFDVTARYHGENGPWQTIQKEITLNSGEHKIVVRFLNDFSDPQNPDPEKRDRNLALDKINVEGPFGLLPPRGTRLVQWLLDGKPAGLPSMKLSGEDFERGEGDSSRDTGAIQLASSGYVKHLIEIAKPGKYRFTLKAGAQQAGGEPAKFDVRLAGKNVGSFSVTAKNQAPQWFKAEAELPAGRHEIQVWFLNDFYDEKTRQDRNFWLHQLTLEGPVDGDGGIATTAVPLLVEKLGTRLFRRPMLDEEKSKWQGFATLALKEGLPPIEALEYVLRGMLVSPSFLYRAEPQPAGEIQHGTALVDEFSLASRLSYFLWSAPPDDRLLELAAKGELRKSLAAEVKRMIGDWHGWSLVEDFAGQWLQLRDIDLASPNERAFPDWKGGIANALKKESQSFVDHILRENRSVIEFLNADYTFLNDKLARYYGIQGVKGDKYQKVSLQGTPRGGILTHGSILTLTSTPTRTSPVKRGKYLLENILGTPPPPAPGGVPPLDEKKARSSNLTLRQQFAEHRSNASCAGCHAFLDPMGFAFENYDAIGRWRDQEKKLPIDASGSLVRGQTFQNLADLRNVLVRDMGDQFVKNLAENLLTYALGRGVEYSDKPTVQEIMRKTKATGYRFQDLILAVCESVPFQKMRVSSKEAQ
jgi:mono/diheme cytochrome c family protein